MSEKTPGRGKSPGCVLYQKRRFKAGNAILFPIWSKLSPQERRFWHDKASLEMGAKRAGERTPAPWSLFNKDGISIVDKDGWFVCLTDTTARMHADNQANAAFIVQACNAFDADRALIADLVKALEGVIRVADRKTVEFAAARAALTRAGGNT